MVDCLHPTITPVHCFHNIRGMYVTPRLTTLLKYLETCNASELVALAHISTPLSPADRKL